MKRIPVFLAACFILLFSCKQESNISPKPFTASMLAKQEFRVDPARDTTLHTLHGSAISIRAGTFTVTSPIDIEIREAFTPSEILAAGLTTTSNGRPLRSAGMIYFNAIANGDNVALKKPVAVSIPNNYYDEQMQVFKGVETDSGMNWTAPQPTDTTPQSQNWIAGKRIFNANCASCHSKDLIRDLTGPALRGIERRWKDYNHLRMWIRNWRAAVDYGLPDAVRAQNLKPTAMTVFEFLTDKEIEQVITYITNESLKPGPPIPGSLCNDTIYYSIPKENQSFLNTEPDITNNINIQEDTTTNEIARTLPVRKQLADTSSRDTRRRSSGIYTGGYYDFEITSAGWYNIDALIDVEGTSQVQLTASIEGDAPNDLTVYLFCPDKKILIAPYYNKGPNYFFDKPGAGLPLFLNDRAVLIAFGSKGKKMYLGATELYIKQQQNVATKVEETTEEKLKQILRDKQIGSIDIGIDKKEMMIREVPCEFLHRRDSARAIAATQ